MRFTRVALIFILALSNAACERGRARDSDMTQSASGDIPAPPDVAAAPADAERTASGLACKKLQDGTGTTHPKADSRVRVHYTGWTTDGKMFDSSVARGEPIVFGLDEVIPGWTEGVQLMKAGEKRRFWIPAELAYNNAPGAPAGMLVFDIELLDIVEPPVAPADVAAPPADAGKSPSGLAFKVLQPGTGTRRPDHDDVVTVQYSGWLTSGELFDSTALRGEPATFSIGDAVAGFREGVQLMVEGEKRRLWIPEALAYKGQAGAPPGMLVFDVELVSIGR
jgi:FKBP-type peptidyl-prolyl cis-trans isomerase